MSIFGELISKTTLPAFNEGLTSASEETMIALLGPHKGTLTATCQNELASEIAARIMTTRNLGPFSATGIAPAVDSLERIVRRLQREKPDLLAAMNTVGMLCVRLRNPTSGQPSTKASNHAWGTAIDISIDGRADIKPDGMVQRGIAELIPFFNFEGWFSGVGFRSSEDDTHFEVADETVNAWADAGLFGAVVDDLPFDTPAAASSGATDARALLIAAMNDHSLTDNSYRAGIAAIAAVESDFKPRSEGSYRGTAPARVRAIFTNRVAGLSDAEIVQLTNDDRAFFNRVYAHILDNDGPEDGFTYRGRGIFQLTGKSNYKRYGGLAGLDLLGNPDLANDPKNAAELAVVYMMDHCAQGAGFEQMKLAVGRSTADINARKNQRFSEFLASGEFNA